MVLVETLMDNDVSDRAQTSTDVTRSRVKYQWLSLSHLVALFMHSLALSSAQVAQSVRNNQMVHFFAEGGK